MSKRTAAMTIGAVVAALVSGVAPWSLSSAHALSQDRTAVAPAAPAPPPAVPPTEATTPEVEPEPAPAPPPAPPPAKPPAPKYVADEEPVEETPGAALEPVSCQHDGRRRCVHYDLGLHGYVVSGTQLFGVQLGIGYEWFSFRVQGGPIINDGLTDRFDTALLGPYFAGSVSGYFLRSERFDARAGLGVMALWLPSVSTELLYWAGTLGVAGAWYFLPPLGAFVELQVVPLRSDGLDLGYAPVLLQLGVEVTL